MEFTVESIRVKKLEHKLSIENVKLRLLHRMVIDAINGQM